MADAPNFPKVDPAQAQFWNLRYGAGFTPWDAGRVPGQFRDFIGSRGTPGRALVPGCGSAWEVRFLAEAGWHVVGIDFSPDAVESARSILGPWGDRVRQADFFAPVEGAPFDVVYERALLCALPRRLWRDWGRRMGELVASGGVLAGYFFFDAGERGPPFPLHSHAELAELLEPAFELLEDRAAVDSIPVFAGKERWQVWRRR